MNKTVLITGASRGIGRETAILFAKNNYNVVINYKNNKYLANSLKESLEARYNIKALTIKADISNEEEVQAMVADAIEEFKKIDVLVNNASIAKDNILELDEGRAGKGTLIYKDGKFTGKPNYSYSKSLTFEKDTQNNPKAIYDKAKKQLEKYMSTKEVPQDPKRFNYYDNKKIVDDFLNQ